MTENACAAMWIGKPALRRLPCAGPARSAWVRPEMKRARPRPGSARIGVGLLSVSGGEKAAHVRVCVTAADHPVGDGDEPEGLDRRCDLLRVGQVLVVVRVNRVSRRAEPAFLGDVPL